jgi:hypothetical protein
LNSIVFSVQLDDLGLAIDPIMEEAERLVGPLGALYGRSKRLMGFEAIKVWVQRSANETRLNIYLEARDSVTKTLEAGRHSTHPVDLKLRQLFESVTGRTWEDVTSQWTVQILDWSAAAAQRDADEEESS